MERCTVCEAIFFPSTEDLPLVGGVCKYCVEKRRSVGRRELDNTVASLQAKIDLLHFKARADDDTVLALRRMITEKDAEIEHLQAEVAKLTADAIMAIDVDELVSRRQRALAITEEGGPVSLESFK